MRKQSIIVLLLFAFICMMASPNLLLAKKKKKDKRADAALAVGDSIFVDSLGNVKIGRAHV